jgi:hypothetical protein
MTDRIRQLNPRERRLLAITLGIVLICGVALLARAALSSLNRLDSDIAQFELDNLTQQHVQRGAVEQAYNAVVTEHSSGLTAAQIHDHLRREIYGLSRMNFPATKNKPARTVSLVSIPTLPEGQLKLGAGHREYQIRVDIPVASLNLLLVFIERLELSEQLLRIDRLEVGRVPGGRQVHASMEITRTVLDNPEVVGGTVAGAGGAG